jgi:hypothetical protein
MASEVVDKAAMARLMREHGLATAPFHEVGLSDVRQLVDLYPASARLVTRTSRKGTADRNLPRLVDATAQSIVEWSKDLRPGTVLLVSPYGHLIASAEVAMTPSWALVEAVYGVWELDNRQQPGSAMGRRDSDGIAWTHWALSTASARRRFSFEAGIDSNGPVPSWLLRAFCDWASLHAPSLDALTSTISEPQIVKVLLYAEWGMQAMNARPIGDLLVPSDNYDLRPPPGTPVVSSTDQSIAPTPAVILTVSAAREDAASLETLIGRMVHAGVEVAYLESGLLSHTAIALREAGILVRRR